MMGYYPKKASTLAEVDIMDTTMTLRPQSVQDSLERLVASRREDMVKFGMSRYNMSREDAEDCVQGAIYSFFKRYDHEMGFVPITYLFTAGKTAIAHYIRKNSEVTRAGKIKPKTLSEGSFAEGFLESLSHDPFVEHHAKMCAKEDLRALWAALSVREKELLTAILADGCNVTEAAEKLGVSPSRGHQLMNHIRLKATRLGLNR